MNIKFATLVVILCASTFLGSAFAITVNTESSFTGNDVAEESFGVLVSSDMNNFSQLDSPQAQGLFSITMKQNSIIQFKPVYVKADIQSSNTNTSKKNLTLTVSSDKFPELCFGSISLCSDGPETAVQLDPNNKKSVNIVGNSVYKVMLETPNSLKQNSSLDFNVNFTITENVSQGTV